ncbi:hypothetical protein GCM10018772_25060 [Streptomyces fumanus]|uniref:Response regulatory domain-containing protein n=1 Tax=Streptomyces fumanus TaxID=67302 RepID=A0A919AFB9_9ACTN|nr:hypothetical protein GCM10018772_25060 [Streptomyces fumanus]
MKGDGGQPAGARLLLADDGPSVRDSAGRYLRFVGYKVRTGGTGHMGGNSLPSRNAYGRRDLEKVPRPGVMTGLW